MEKKLTGEYLTSTLGARSSIIVRDGAGDVRVIGVNFTDNIKGHHIKKILEFSEVTDDTKMVLRTPYWGESWDDVDDQLEEDFEDVAHGLDMEFARNLYHLRAEVGLLLPDIDPWEMNTYSRDKDVDLFSKIMKRIEEIAVYKA